MQREKGSPQQVYILRTVNKDDIENSVAAPKQKNLMTGPKRSDTLRGIKAA